MKSPSVYHIAAGACAILLLALGFRFTSGYSYHKQVPLTSERELKVTLDAGFGDVNISRGTSSVVLDADFSNEKEADIDKFLEYVPRAGIGYLTVNTAADLSSRSGKHNLEFHGFHSSSCDLRFTDAVPISFELGFGLGSSDIDLTGLNVKDLKISAGASSVHLRFDKPNKNVIEELTIESGLSKFNGEGLCNANFNRLKFEGGVGSYRLDFGGKLEKEVDASIEVGLGSLQIVIPENVGAKIIYEKNWFSHVDLDHDFSEQEEGNYYTSNYRTASGKMNIRIEAGLGSVSIHHSR